MTFYQQFCRFVENSPSSTPPSSAFFGLLRAYVAAALPVDDFEGVRHALADVGETETHERDAQDGVQHRHHLAPVGLGGDVAVPWGQEKVVKRGGQQVSNAT